MKKILIYGQYMEGLKDAFQKQGYAVESLPVGTKSNIVEEKLSGDGIDWLFTFNFEPALAELCVKLKKVYFSWVVDWPHPHIYAKAAQNKGIYIFIFDRQGYYEALERGMENVYYLPLAPDVDCFEKVIENSTEEKRKRFRADVSFMGNLYDAKKHSLYDQIQYLPPMVKGYLDGLMSAQKKVWGYTFIGEAIRAEMWQQLRQYVKWDLGDKYESVYETLFESMLCKKIAQEERKEMCSLLAERYDFALYTKSNTDFDARIRNCGPIDYFQDMPVLFHESRININITLRSIKSGIPLRCLDVLASGGFLMSNYQPELTEYFVDGEEVVIWQDFDDLITKIDYYLKHESERQQIAKAGYEKVKTLFHFDVLAGQMMEQVEQEENR